MSDRDKLILRAYEACRKVVMEGAEGSGLVDGGIDLGDGLRIAIVEELTLGYQAHLGEVWETCRTTDGDEYDGVHFRIVTPHPAEA